MGERPSEHALVRSGGRLRRPEEVREHLYLNVHRSPLTDERRLDNGAPHPETPAV